MLQHPDSCHALSKPPVSCAIRTAARSMPAVWFIGRGGLALTLVKSGLAW